MTIDDRTVRRAGLSACAAVLVLNATAPDAWWKFAGLASLWMAVTVLAAISRRPIALWCAGGGFGVAVVQLLKATGVAQ